jgi:hypothetical protein
MKLEFLREGASDCALIRLYSFEQTQVQRLKEVFSSLAAGLCQEVALHSEPGIEAMQGCELFLQAGSRDLGILERKPLKFTCALTADGWTVVADLVDAFCGPKGSKGFQWLNEDGPVSLLLSVDGRW